jgi:hypothetical protein
MPITPCLGGAAFAPKAIQTVSVAFKEVCKTVDVPHGEHQQGRHSTGLNTMSPIGHHEPFAGTGSWGDAVLGLRRGNAIEGGGSRGHPNDAGI